MTDSDGPGVGGVVGPGNLFHIEKPLGHEHDLPLLGSAVPGYRLFDLHGGIFKNRDPQLFRRQQDDPPAVGHGDAGGDVLGEKQLLHRHLVGVEGVDELLHVVGDLEQPAGQGDARGRGDDPVLEQGVFPPLGPDDPKADGGHTRVDA